VAVQYVAEGHQMDARLRGSSPSILQQLLLWGLDNLHMASEGMSSHGTTLHVEANVGWLADGLRAFDRVKDGRALLP